MLPLGYKLFSRHGGRISSRPFSAGIVPATSGSSTANALAKAMYYIPRAERDASKPMVEIDRLYDHRLKRRARKDPTRELNYTPAHWERHKSVWRRFRHVLTTLGSSPFQRLLFPDLMLTATIAGGLTYYNELVADASSQLFLSSASMAAGTTAIGLLSAFRLNASYGRYNEVRKTLSGVNTASRNLAAGSLMWLTLQKDKDRMLNLIKSFSVALHFFCNKKGGHYHLRIRHPNFEEQIVAEFHAEMLDIFQDEKDADFVKILKGFRNKENVPLSITCAMRKIIAENCEVSGSPVYNRELDLHVQQLVESLGGCERVLKTPIPTCFTRHTSRLLFAWSNLLPFAIYPTCGPMFTIPASLAISYSVMGIEDIGVQLEEPLNILPLRQYSEGVYDGVETIKTAYG